MDANRFGAAIAIVATVAACSPAAEYAYLQEGMPHAEAVVRDVSRDWNADKLIEQADPRMLAVLPEAKLREMIAVCGQKLGVARSQQTVASSVMVETAIPGKTALYFIELKGEKGIGRFTVKLQKVGERWKILGFWVRMMPTENTSPPS